MVDMTLMNICKDNISTAISASLATLNQGRRVFSSVIKAVYLISHSGKRAR